MVKDIPESDQIDIRSVLLSKVGGIKLTDFNSDFKKLTGRRLEYKALGFPNLRSLLDSIPSVAKVLPDSKTGVDKVFGVTGENLLYVNATAKKAQYKEGEVPASGKQKRRSGKKSPVAELGQSKTNSTASRMPLRPTTLEEINQALVPNMKNQYAICLPRQDFMNRDNINQTFSEFGELAETSFTGKFVFLRYTTKEAALKAYLTHRDDYDIRLPYEKNEPKKLIKERDASFSPDKNHNHKETIISNSKGQRNTDLDVFIGNLHPDTTEEELWNVFSDVEIQEIRMKKSPEGNKCFGFVTVTSKPEMAKLVCKNGSVSLGGRRLLIQQSFKDGGVTEATPEDKALLQGMTKHNVRDFQENYSTPPKPATRTLEDVAHDMDQTPLNGEESHFAQNGEREAATVMRYDASRGRGSGRGLARGRGRGYPTNYNLPQNSYNYQMDTGSEENEMFELFVANFPFFTSWKTLLELFSPFDAVGVRMQNNNDFSRTTVCFVQFLDWESAVNAFVNLDGLEFMGRPLRINFAYSTFAPEDVVEKRLKDLKLTVNIKGSQKEERKVEMIGKDTPKEKNKVPAYGQFSNGDEYYEDGYDEEYYEEEEEEEYEYMYQPQYYQPRGGYQGYRGGYQGYRGRGGFHIQNRGGYIPRGFHRPVASHRGMGRGFGNNFIINEGPCREVQAQHLVEAAVAEDFCLETQSQKLQQQETPPNSYKNHQQPQGRGQLNNTSKPTDVGQPERRVQKQTQESAPPGHQHEAKHQQPHGNVGKPYADPSQHKANEHRARNDQNNIQTPPRIHQSQKQSPPKNHAKKETPPKKQQAQGKKQSPHQRVSNNQRMPVNFDDGPPPLEPMHSPARLAHPAAAHEDYSDMPALEASDMPPPLEQMEMNSDMPPLEKMSPEKSTKKMDGMPLMMEQRMLVKMINDLCPQIGLVSIDHLPRNEEFSVVVTHIEDNPRFFWGQVIVPGFLEGVNELGEKTRLLSEEAPEDQVSNNRGAVYYESTWSRVWIIGKHGKSADVFYMDYGNVETIDFNRIKGLPDHFWGLPPQAVPFCVTDIKRPPLQVYQQNMVTVCPSAKKEDTVIRVV